MASTGNLLITYHSQLVRPMMENSVSSHQTQTQEEADEKKAEDFQNVEWPISAAAETASTIGCPKNTKFLNFK
jgi:hypothetical protein